MTTSARKRREDRSVDTLRELRDAFAALRRKWVECRLELLEWFPHQGQLLRDVRLFRLLRTGNQLGKTEAGCAEVLYAALGWHPYRDPTLQAGEYWIVCSSWSQSVAIQHKLYALCPRHRLRPGTTHSEEYGFGGRHPHVAVQHEDGTYSVIRFKTTGQESIDLSSATIDGALFDEPPKDLTLFAEIQKRVQARAGWILITMTPIGADVMWLKDMVDDGTISETHARLEPAALIPEGRDRPIRIRDVKGKLFEWGEAWIEHVRHMTPVAQRAIRLDGAWQVQEEDAYFRDVWVPELMILDELPNVEAWGQVGVDHGHRPGKQYGVLLLVDDQVPDEPVIYAAAEYVDAAGVSDPVRDAEGLVDMLQDVGWRWSDLRFVGGDRDHMPGTAHRKSNRDLMRALEGVLGVEELQPRIRTVKRGGGRNWGSVETGLRYLYRAMATGRFYVHRRCTRLIRTLPRFVKRQRDDEFKDVLDALRYGLENLVFAQAPSQPAAALRIG